MRLRERLAALSPAFGGASLAARIGGSAETEVGAGERDVELGRVPDDRSEEAEAGKGRGTGKGTFEETEKSGRIAQLRALIAEVIARDARVEGTPGTRGLARELAGLPARLVRAVETLPGEVRQTDDGPLRVIERLLLPQHCHGRVAVAGALAADVAALAQLAFDPELHAVDLSRMLILDTETTGLSGGTGTVAFLIGLAYFEEGALKVEQLFLDQLGGEAPMLRHLAARLAQASVLVTYNGKAFDWPLLRTRFVLNRVARPALPPHLDLLHCARRLLRTRMESVRLVDVERALLGFYREDDVGGAEIPGIYLDYLRSGHAGAVERVLVHNEHDVIALAALIERLCARYASVQASADPDDHLACARVALKARDLERAQCFARAAAEGGGTAPVTRDAHALCAQIARRRGDAQLAVDAWKRSLAASGGGERSAHAHLALARLYERDLRDLVRAYAHARHTSPAEGPHAHGRRLGRLSRRLLRAQP